MENLYCNYFYTLGAPACCTQCHEDDAMGFCGLADGKINNRPYYVCCSTEHWIENNKDLLNGNRHIKHVDFEYECYHETEMAVNVTWINVNTNEETIERVIGDEAIANIQRLVNIQQYMYK